MRRARRRSAGLAIVALSFLLVQCAEPRFCFVEFSANGRQDVKLNEVLTLRFSADVEPGSVTPGTVRILDENGQLAAGEFVVVAQSLQFHPRHPMRPDLGDAGLKPGHRYRVELPGTPRIRCVHSSRGGALEGGWRGEFRTVTRPQPEGLFVDPQPAEAPAIVEAKVNVAGADFELRFTEPLDPRPLADAHFRLRGPWSRPAHPDDDPELSCEWRANDPGAVLKLSIPPSLPAPLMAGEQYWLAPPVDALRDFGNRPLSLVREDSYLPLYWTGTDSPDD